MSAMAYNLDESICTTGLHPHRPDTAESEAPHCAACAMVDELIQELVRKQMREANR